MTHHRDDKAIGDVLEVLTANGLDGMAEAMKIERSRFHGAGPREQGPKRQCYANGFKPKPVKSRLGELAPRIPQVRDLPPWMEGFYPQALERAQRSERALKLAVAEMYVASVSARRVAAITEVLCGLSVTCIDVSRAAGQLDAELEAWRTDRWE